MSEDIDRTGGSTSVVAEVGIVGAFAGHDHDAPESAGVEDAVLEDVDSDGGSAMVGCQVGIAGAPTVLDHDASKKVAVEDASLEDVDSDGGSASVGDEVGIAGDHLNADGVTPKMLLRQHPLKLFYRLQKWTVADLAAARIRDRTVVVSFIRQLSNYGSYYDHVNNHLTSCQCVMGIDPCFYEKLADVLG